MIKDFYSKLSDKEKKIAHWAIAAVVCLLFDALLLRPVLSKLDALDKEINEKTSSIKRDIRFLSYEEKIKKEQELFSVYQTDEAIAEEEIIAGFLKTVELMASESNINLAKLNPAEVTQKKGYFEYYANLECSGKLDNLITFMHKIDTTKNLLRIVKVNMTGKKASPEEINAAMKVAKLIIDPSTIGNYDFMEEEFGLTVEKDDVAGAVEGKDSSGADKGGGADAQDGGDETVPIDKGQGGEGTGDQKGPDEESQENERAGQGVASGEKRAGSGSDKGIGSGSDGAGDDTGAGKEGGNATGEGEGSASADGSGEGQGKGGRDAAGGQGEEGKSAGGSSGLGGEGDGGATGEDGGQGREDGGAGKGAGAADEDKGSQGGMGEGSEDKGGGAGEGEGPAEGGSLDKDGTAGTGGTDGQGGGTADAASAESSAEGEGEASGKGAAADQGSGSGDEEGAGSGSGEGEGYGTGERGSTGEGSGIGEPDSGGEGKGSGEGAGQGQDFDGVGQGRDTSEQGTREADYFSGDDQEEIYADDKSTTDGESYGSQGAGAGGASNQGEEWGRVSSGSSGGGEETPSPEGNQAIPTKKKEVKKTDYQKKLEETTSGGRIRVKSLESLWDQLLGKKGTSKSVQKAPETKGTSIPKPPPEYDPNDKTNLWQRKFMKTD